MAGEGIGSIFSAALGYAPTLFSYFNPSKSPYYAMTVACVVGISVLFLFDKSAWLAAFVPIALVVVILAIATMKSPKFSFSVDEYNDQLKFARSLAVTTAVICIIFLVCNRNNPLGYGSIAGGARIECSGTGCDEFLSWAILIVYIFALSQILLFLAYAFVFASYTELVSAGGGAGEPAVPGPDAAHAGQKIAERNYVQIALVMCAYLAGMTWIVDRVGGTSPFEILSLLLFGGIWLACAINVLLFVSRNFSLERPIDSVQPLQPLAANVITFKHVEAKVADGTGT